MSKTIGRRDHVVAQDALERWMPETASVPALEAQTSAWRSGYAAAIKDSRTAITQLREDARVNGDDTLLLDYLLTHTMWREVAS